MRQKLSGIMHERAYDVIIIGCGVSGLAAALRCLNAGLKCIILTDNLKLINSEFQSTPCESVHPGLKGIVEMLIENDVVEYASRGKYSGILTADGFNSLGVSDGELWSGYHIDKPLFLKSLMVKALMSGLVIKENEQVKCVQKFDNNCYRIKAKSGEEYIGKYIIDASGSKQVLGRLLKLEKTYFSPYLTCTSGLVGNIPDLDYRHFTTSFLMDNLKWTWIAPEINNCCTWTCVSLKNNFSKSKPLILNEYDSIGPTLVKDVRWRTYNKITYERIVLTGEAAGLIDPASGQGNLAALMSAIMAADCVINFYFSYSSKKIVSLNYEDWFKEFYHSKMLKLREYYLKNSF